MIVWGPSSKVEAIAAVVTFGALMTTIFLATQSRRQERRREAATVKACLHMASVGYSALADLQDELKFAADPDNWRNDVEVWRSARDDIKRQTEWLRGVDLLRLPSTEVVEAVVDIPDLLERAFKLLWDDLRHDPFAKIGEAAVIELDFIRLAMIDLAREAHRLGDRGRPGDSIHVRRIMDDARRWRWKRLLETANRWRLRFPYWCNRRIGDTDGEMSHTRDRGPH